MATSDDKQRPSAGTPTDCLSCGERHSAPTTTCADYDMAHAAWSAPRRAPQGHGEPCAMCGKPCNALAGNPGRWPLALVPTWRADFEAGRIAWHCTRCVMRSMAALRELTEAAESYATGGSISRLARATAESMSLITGPDKEDP